MSMLNRQLSIAPMMDWTDRHCRYFLRLISRHVLLYTEMVTANAILHGKRHDLLNYNPSEHPIALQLGGSEPDALASCTKIAESYGYDEVNLNVGCPSDRVQTGQFGACLMAKPQLVADCVAAMRAASHLPITVKTRIGIDDQDSYEHLTNFIGTVAESGCHTFIVHARKAWLQGLSPKENREIPPLRYDVVQQVKRDFPHLQIIINGGITNLDQVKQHLETVDGVMIGRAAYHNPYLLAQVDQLFYSSKQPSIDQHTIVENFIPYVEQQLAQGVPLARMTRHILGLFQGLPGARAWRRHLSQYAPQKDATSSVIQQALRHL